MQLHSGISWESMSLLWQWKSTRAVKLLQGPCRTQYALVSSMELAKTSCWTFCTHTTVLHLRGVWVSVIFTPHACRMSIVSIGFLKMSHDPYWWLTGRVALFPGPCPCHSLCTRKQHGPIAENEATGRARWRRVVHTPPYIRLLPSFLYSM